jgi:opacity protein-like surface antigen
VTPPPFTATVAAVNSTPSWRFGFAVGAGVEARLWDTNWLGRVEYLHYDFGDSGSSASVFGGTPGTSFASGRLTADVVRAGLSYKFDRDRFTAVGYPAAGGYAAMPVKAPRAAPVLWSWSGFYIGAHAGYGWGRDPFTDPITTGLVLTDINSNGFVGGFQAGGNWQWGAWVGGLEIDLSGTDIKKTTTGTVVFPGGDTETTRGPTSLICSVRRGPASAFSPGPTCWSMAPAAWPGPGLSRPTWTPRSSAGPCLRTRTQIRPGGSAGWPALVSRAGCGRPIGSRGWNTCTTTSAIPAAASTATGPASHRAT